MNRVLVKGLGINIVSIIKLLIFEANIDFVKYRIEISKEKNGLKNR